MKLYGVTGGSPVEPADLVDADLAREWNELADRVAATPFHRPGWFISWWAAFGSGRPEILRARRDGRLVGVLPMARRRGRLVGLSNWHTFVFGPLAEDADAAHDVVDQGLDGARWSTTFGHLMPDDLASVTAAARNRRCAVEVAPVQQSPYISIDRDFATYLGGRDARWLKQLERRRRKLEGMGELTLVVHDGSENLDEILADAFRIEGLGWKTENGTAITSRPETTRFYTRVAHWAATQGMLRISTLSLDGRSIAVDLCLEDGGSHYFLKTGFDPEFRDAAPGLILRHDMIKRAFDLRLRSYELLGSAERYKLQWTDQVHDIKQVRTFPRSLTGSSARLSHGGAARVGRARSRVGAIVRRREH